MSHTPAYEREPQQAPRFEVAIAYPTAFALEEYMADRRVHLTQAVCDMSVIGLTVLEYKLAEYTVEVEYPKGEGWYDAPAEIDTDAISMIKSVNVDLPQVLREAIEDMGKRYGRSLEQVFESMIEGARTIRIAHQRGGIIFFVSREEVILFQEDDNSLP